MPLSVSSALGREAAERLARLLKVLTGAGLVTVERRGTWMWYSLVPGALGSLGDLLR